MHQQLLERQQQKRTKHCKHIYLEAVAVFDIGPGLGLGLGPGLGLGLEQY